MTSNKISILSTKQKKSHTQHTLTKDTKEYKSPIKTKVLIKIIIIKIKKNCKNVKHVFVMFLFKT